MTRSRKILRHAVAIVAVALAMLPARDAQAQSKASPPKKTTTTPPVVTPTASEGSTATAIRGRPVSTASGRAVNGALQKALANPDVRNAVRAEVLRQLGVRRPLALVKGYWASAIDLVPVYQLAAVKPALLATLGVNGPQLINEAGVSADRLVVSFVPAAFGQIVIPEFMGDITATLGKDALTNHMTDFIVGPIVMIFVLAGVGAEISIIVTDMVVKWSEWLGMKYNDYTTSTGPNQDYDGDGILNKDDTDDDNDGVADKDDNYPYDPLASICDCGRPHAAFSLATGAAGNFLPALVSVLNATQAQSAGARSLSLGTVIQNRPNTLTMIF